MSAPAQSPKKVVKKAAKPKKPAAHPKYAEMIAAAIAALKDRKGSSRQAIVKYIMAHFNVGKDASAVNSRVKVALRNGVKKGSLKQAKGTGASGSFKVGEVKKAKKAKKAKKVKKAKKPKKAKKAKKPKVKKPKAKKAAKPKKAKAAKAAKKPAAKKPKAKKAKKPKAKKAAPAKKA